MTKRLLGLTTIILFLGGIVAGIEAATINLQYKGFDLLGVRVTRTINGGRLAPTTAGLLKFDVLPGGDFSVPYSNLYTFCIEPGEIIGSGSVLYEVWDLEAAPSNVSGGMGSTKANLLRELYAVYFPLNPSAISLSEAVALQIATWEIVREDSGSLNVYTGNVRFGLSGYARLAQSYLIDITTHDYTLRTDIMAAMKVGAQDVWIPVEPPKKVPEPATVVLLGLGLLLIGMVARRYRATRDEGAVRGDF